MVSNIAADIETMDPNLTGLQDKEITALIAYMQRLGVDIKKANEVAAARTPLGGQ